jgi:hypothetical protein
LGIKRLALIFQNGVELVNMIEGDPNGVGRSEVRRGIERDLACYKVLYEEKKKTAVQLTLDKFFTKQPVGY